MLDFSFCMKRNMDESGSVRERWQHSTKEEHIPLNFEIFLLGVKNSTPKRAKNSGGLIEHRSAISTRLIENPRRKHPLLQLPNAENVYLL